MKTSDDKALQREPKTRAGLRRTMEIRHETTYWDCHFTGISLSAAPDGPLSG
jgi:hypothetical protein